MEVREEAKIGKQSPTAVEEEFTDASPRAPYKPWSHTDVSPCIGTAFNKKVKKPRHLGLLSTLPRFFLLVALGRQFFY